MPTSGTSGTAGQPFALEVDRLSFAYGSKRVLHEVSFGVAKGGICGLFGPNGSGKTTLFRCCIGLQKPLGGVVRVNGINAAGMDIAERARHMAYVPQ